MAFSVVRAFSEKSSGAFLFSDSGITLLGGNFSCKKEEQTEPKIAKLRMPPRFSN